MRTRGWFTSLVLASLAVACGDQPTEVVPERDMTQGPGIIGAATSSSDDGLSITTDKDDYQPGDTVWFTGTGWPANDVLDILLEDEPATHPPHTWTVNVGEDGAFLDSTYVVDVGDIDVTFTLTATSRATGRSLTVTFTDGNPLTPTVTGQNPNPVAAGNSATYTVTVPYDGNASSCTVNLSATATASPAWPAPPPGGFFSFSPGSVTGAGGSSPTSTLTVTTPAGMAPNTYRFTVTETPQTVGCQGPSSRTSTLIDLVVAAAGPAATTTDVASSLNPSVSGQSVTFTATVESGGTAIGANGAVSFRQGGTDCTNGVEVQAATNLDATGQATYSASFNASGGSQVIRACYGGATGFGPSSGSVTQDVDKAETSVTLTKAPAGNSVFSQPVTVYVTVSVDAPGSGTPSGNVRFEKGGTACGAGTDLLATEALDGSSQASFTTSGLVVGTHTIRACYAGDLDFEGSDNHIAHTVEKASTTTVVESSDNPSILNQPVIFGVRVSADAPATATPEGSVTLKDGTCAGTTIDGPTALDVDGKASFTVSNLTVGNHTITACYAGNDSFKSSYGSLTQQVKYNFDGLYAPVDRPNTMNVSKAGQGIPLKWRLTDYFGAPVLDFAPAALGVAVSGLQCTVSTTLDQVEEYAGNSGLQNLGDGYYQLNWKTPSSYANSCKAIGLNLGEGTPRGPLAYFNFKK
jgi:hypothetical protein